MKISGLFFLLILLFSACKNPIQRNKPENLAPSIGIFSSVGSVRNSLSFFASSMDFATMK